MSGSFGPGGYGGAAPPSKQPRMVTSAERLRRLLALVPYVVSRKVVSVSEAAAAFGPDVMVLEPPDLREAVIRRLKGVLA